MSSLPFQTATQTKHTHTHTHTHTSHQLAYWLAHSLWMDLSQDNGQATSLPVTHITCIHTHTHTHTHTYTHTDAQLAAQVLQLNTGPRMLGSTQVRQTAITDLTLLPLCCGLVLTYMPVFASERIHLPLVSQSTVHCTSLHRYRAHVEHSWC
jgi:hypothetical protein